MLIYVDICKYICVYIYIFKYAHSIPTYLNLLFSFLFKWDDERPKP